jgi:hypothetical protein
VLQDVQVCVRRAAAGEEGEAAGARLMHLGVHLVRRECEGHHGLPAPVRAIVVAHLGHHLRHVL